MTKNELIVCQQYRLPVVLDEHRRAEFSLDTGLFYINSITQFYLNWEKKYKTLPSISANEAELQISIHGIRNFPEKKAELEAALNKVINDVTGFEYEISLERNQRCVFSEDPHYLSVKPELAEFVKAREKALEKQKLKASLRYLVGLGLSRADINKQVKSLLNELDGKKINNAELEAEFNELWKLYPRKKDKKTALNAYIRARNNGTDAEIIKNGIEAYNSEIKRCDIKAEFIKQGGTWFKNECWNDTYDLRKKSTDKLSGKPSFDIEKIQREAEFNDNFDI